MRTQIAIIGAGPAGLFLAHMLHARGIESVVIERRNRDYVEGRVRAGVLEQVAADALAELGLDTRLRREGLVHGGTNLLADGRLFHIDMRELTAGRTVTVYGQQEVMKDLFDAAAARGLSIVFDAEDVTLHEIAGDPQVTYRKDGREHRIVCDFIAGCDGSHGISREAVPSSARRSFERNYPFGWLGILADVPPANEELIYCNHAHGPMRSGRDRRGMAG
jgi:p-hydroxybenzoate 3-monooxygenase